ncbi:glucanase [Microbacterium album]|uniref:Glucanase n=1 Tax=Microbacterium album TaxID=2053191 RepID=A0A917ICS8_9MICO|nr:glucanase [Microbacterium album]
MGTVVLAPGESKAAQAAAAAAAGSAARAAAEHLAAQPSAYWLTPERDPASRVEARVRGLIAQAREHEAALALVVYGLPQRDCGQYSAGGLDESEYDEWTALIGSTLAAAGDVQKIVVLEPDSLALAPECASIPARAAQLRRAVERLEGRNTWIYLDGGHSNWLPVERMASLIDRVGVRERVRGFATNVSNYQTTYDEFAYAHALAAELGWGHAIVDTSRNGAGATDEWCNPRGRVVGDAPGTYGDEVVDTNLWIKPPGESDGECNGGPPAGDWWDAAAIELTRDARSR